MRIQETMTETVQIQLPLIENKQSKNKFEIALIEAVDIVFSSLFGSHKKDIYTYLENCYNIDKQEISDNVENFAHAIEETFGQSAQLIEMEIMRTVHTMCQKHKVKSKQKGITFADYMKAMRSE